MTKSHVPRSAFLSLRTMVMLKAMPNDRNISSGRAFSYDTSTGLTALAKNLRSSMASQYLNNILLAHIVPEYLRDREGTRKNLIWLFHMVV
jgi:hypothetical protein